MLLFVLLVGVKFRLIALLASAFAAPRHPLRVGCPGPGGQNSASLLLSLAAPTRVVRNRCCRACSPP